MSLALVTGASGHVGGNLVQALLTAGKRVRVLVRDDVRAVHRLDVEQVKGDVRAPETLGPPLRGVDVLFHCAAVISIQGSRGGLVADTNVRGVGNVADAALSAGVRRMVHVSSVHAYDIDERGVAITEASPRAAASHSAYNRSKWAGEQALQERVARGLDAVILNPAGVLGPLDPKPSRMGRFFLDLAARRLPVLVTGGFDWVDVRDLARTAIAASEQGRRGENYLVTGRWVSVRALAGLAERFTGVAPPRWTAPQWVARAGAPFMDLYGAATGREPLYTTESLHALRGAQVYDHAKASRELGHCVRPVEETVRDLHAWFAGAGMLACKA